MSDHVIIPDTKNKGATRVSKIANGALQINFSSAEMPVEQVTLMNDELPAFFAALIELGFLETSTVGKDLVRIPD